MRTHLLSLCFLLVIGACRTDPDKPDTAAPDDGPVDADGDGYDTTDDCDDADASIHPDADEHCDGLDEDCDGEVDEDAIDASTWYSDADGDGYGDPGVALEACDPGEGWLDDASDCDDDDPDIHPGAEELCNGVDDDCDGLVDHDDEDIADPMTWYEDADEDGWGDDDTAVRACSQPEGYVEQGGDCDDGDPAFHPGADEDDCTDPEDYNCDGSVGYADEDGDGWAACEDCDDGDAEVHPAALEVCNEIDDDCDGTVDENDALDAASWYADVDADGYGDAASTTAACEQPTGHVADDSDCDDRDAAVNPGATEICNEVDDDCDGTVDEDDATDAASWYADADADGYGDPASSTAACEQPTGFVSDDTDCDDADASSHPGGEEICDGVDNDCDGTVDEDDATDATSWYADADADGYGDPASSTAACEQPTGFVSDDTDCDDDDAAVNPSATEICNEVDDDCDGTVDEDDATDAATWYADADADGYGDPSSTTTACDQPTGFVASATDCDDGDAGINPSATETCNEVDDDCDGTVDEDDAADTDTWYADLDGDGHGDAASSTAACDQPSGYVSDASDCDDTDHAVSPSASETCNEVDDDCDGTVDEDDATDAASWYADADADGHGDAGSTTTACDQPTGYVASATDCDDGDDAVNPDAAEACDGIDNDCDGTVDEDDAGDALTWYADADADGYGDASTTTLACDQPSGHVADDSDCDDGDSGTYPGAAELCDGLDQDCDGDVDEGACLDISNVSDSTIHLGESTLMLASDATLDTETGEIDGLRGAGTGLVDGIYFQTVAQSSGPDLGVFSVAGLEISSGATLWIEGDNALVLVSSEDADISGGIDLSGEDGADMYGTSGPNAGGMSLAGGDDGGEGSDNYYSGATDGGGDGGGFVGSAGVHYGNGGGGAGYCWGGGGGMGGSSSSGTDGSATAGGDGAGSSSEYGNHGGDGGDPYGSYRLEPLLAGSGGAGGLSDTDTNPNGGSGGGGAGGGALQISVDGTLSVSGSIDASGGRGGDAYGGGGGGGSGGAVLLEALELSVSGALYAEGGRGGHGNLSWVPSGTNGGAAGAGSSPGGGAGSRESGGGGGATGWLLLRYLDSVDTSAATLSPDGTGGCTASEAM